VVVFVIVVVSIVY